MSAIAVFGGTFNPFHKGHEEMLSALCEIDSLDKVLIIPTSIPPHKTVDYLASDDDRLNMCRLVAEDYSKAEVCGIELNREGKSYTVDTLKALKAIYPNAELYLSIGGDMLTSFTSWKDYKEILSIATLIAFKRQTTNDVDFSHAVNLLRSEGASIMLLDTEITSVSSTIIRGKIANGLLSPEYLPQKVYDYIKNNKVYSKNV